ncbi:LSM domain containing protein [Leishmania donovani]|uniref:LSM domain family protein n=2 Tax=Leishmania donovani TaxID=5661 RepID=A0A504Y3D7_LEIDO|nr:LSM domain family protein [Leishmania donovani]CAJ1987815.1 LSM domain containing protein [Leishmania donovani]
MPSAHRHRRPKTASVTVPDKSKKHVRGIADESSTGTNARGAAAATGGGSASVDSEKRSKGVPAPAAVLMRALGLAVEASDGTGDKGECNSALLTSSLSCDPSRSMEVEVETRQGYVYTGKLVHIDDHYNVMLNEALVRRARSFDVERAILREKSQQEARLIASSLQGMVTEDADVMQSTSELMPRPRYIGATYIRSNSIFLMRFVDAAGGTGTTAVSAAFSNSALGQLKSDFSMMAASIKAHLQREKMRNRAARRKRLEAKKSAGGGGGGR